MDTGKIWLPSAISRTPSRPRRETGPAPPSPSPWAVAGGEEPTDGARWAPVEPSEVEIFPGRARNAKRHTVAALG